MRSFRFAWVGSAVAVLACGGESDVLRLDPEVRVENGVEIAEMPEWPSPLDADFRWTLRPRVTIPAGDESNPTFFDLYQVLQLSDTRLVALDSHADAPILVVDIPSGDVVHRLGKTGQGPGELGGGSIVVALNDTSFAMFDPSNRQRHEFAGGRQLPSEPWRPDFVPSGGTYLEGSGIIARTVLERGDQWNFGYVLLDDEGTRLGPFAALPKRPPDAPLGTIHRGRSLSATLRRELVAMWSATPTVEIHGDGGRLLRRIDLPVTNRTVSAQDLDDWMTAFQFEPGPLAVTNEMQALNDTVFGLFTSRLWRTAEDPTLPADLVLWRLITSRGRYLGTVERPRDFRFLGLGHGTIWARVLDQETLLPSLVELELVPPAQ